MVRKGFGIFIITFKDFPLFQKILFVPLQHTPHKFFKLGCSPSPSHYPPHTGLWLSQFIVLAQKNATPQQLYSKTFKGTLMIFKLIFGQTTFPQKLARKFCVEHMICEILRLFFFLMSKGQSRTPCSEIFFSN